MTLLGASDRVESILPEPVRHVDNDELRYDDSVPQFITPVLC